MTGSEYRCREQELRAELVPPHELVEIAIERYARWTDADYTADAGARVLNEEAWTRACSEIEQELIELFRGGTLKGEDRDAGVHISAGSFYDWLGEPMPVWSKSGCAYEIFPDSQAEEAASKQRARRSVEALITTAPGRGDLPLDLGSPWRDDASAEMA
ncbi:MAG: hypothetical protein HY874_03790 [Chloroflexi bacterium]|nr:hypothetical protein [Chloroflexota bacterium]